MLSQNLPRKRRGTRSEREVAKDLAAIVDAFRVKGSGAIPGLPGDVMAKLLPDSPRWELEIKRRGKPPQTLLKWLGGSDALVICPELGERTVLLRWPRFIELLRAINPPVMSAEVPPEIPKGSSTYRKPWPSRPFPKRAA